MSDAAVSGAGANPAVSSIEHLRLVGKIAWRRGLAQGQYATVPPGFGIEIVDGARMDIAAWRAGCQAFQSMVD